MRTFISIEIPDDIKDNVEKVIGEMKALLPPIKWVDKKNLHLTMKFLGWVDDPKIDPLKASITDIVKDFGSIKIRFSGLGVFPSSNRPRVIWVGISEGSEKVKELAEKLNERLTKEGYRKEEDRDFSPHLTIGRIKERIETGALNNFIEKKERENFGGFTAKNVSLMKSTLRRSGPIYEEIEKIGLSS